MSTPNVCVLIPAYNAEKYIAAALDSVYAQTYSDFEVIVVDDGSDDETGAVVARYPEVIYRKCPHRGISATRNTCLEMASGEWLAFLDADDLWHPEKLSRQIAYLEAHPDCQILFTRAKNFYDGDPAEMTSRQRQELEGDLREVLPSCLFHRSLYDTHGGFLTDYPWGEDTEWTVRLRTAGINMGHCLPEKLYLRRIHSGNITLTHPKKNTAVARQIFLSAMRSRVKQARKETIQQEDAKP